MTPLPRKFLARKLLPVLISAAALLLARFPAGAIIDATLQMQLGNPSGATADPTNHNHYLIQRPVEAMDYSDNLSQPNWVSWDFTTGDTNNAVNRSTTYFTDTNLPPGFYRVTDNDYKSSGWDRGHMCPSGDRLDSREDNDMVFLMSNIIPQAGNQNSGVWGRFETYCRTLAAASNEVLITCGPSRFTGAYIASNHVAIPGTTWKIAVVVPLGSSNALDRINYFTRVIALDITNSDAVAAMPWTNFVTSVSEVQRFTGFTFFTALPPNLAAVLRSKVDGQAPPPPVISSFSPTSGAVGTSVTITGTNLAFATNVTFNGTSASFTINSTTNLTAAVPADATSGYISAATLGGTTTSSGSFIVGTNATPDLAITATHTGNFTQGDTGDSYTIVVTNVGTAAFSGTVTVTDTLPAGLTATAMGGSGWIADLGTRTCTRADSLLAGAAYPPITLTVNVSANAPATVTNTAIVSGGGDTKATNNTATDPTTINAAAAPTATTGTASGVGTTVATLNGTVNPNGQSTTAQFEYGTNTSYGSTTPVSGTFTGTTAQAVSANLTGLAEATTYHFRLAATNALGSTNGLDQTFTTTTAGVPDLAITVTHTGNFTQGDTGDIYTIIVTNVGTAASSGTVTVSNVLPAGLTATDISGTGWTPNLSTLTCTRSNSLTAGTNYPPITLTVNVATNAPLSVTNIAVFSGGDETNLVNNTASDPTTINPSSGGGGTNTLVGWDMNALPGGLNNFGPSPMAPATNAANLTIVGLTRGSGIGTNANQAAARAWGGNTFTDTTSTAAIAANRFATFSLTANSGYKVSYTAISKFDYRHSGTGPPNGLLQYQIGSGAFADIAALSYPSNTSSGGSLSPIDLSGISALQNVAAGTNITFRIVNWGGTSSAGTWYIFDVASSTALDFVVQGSVSPVVAPAADLTISKSHTGNFTQGDTSDSYTITVTNIGAAATAGSVSVVDTLPAGLTPAAISGDGWSANLTNLTCTRADPLAVGASYPPITVTVNITASAPASVTNIATASGGADASPANNTAADPTTILAAAAPTAITGTASGVGTSMATLNGAVNPNGQSATVQFQYGLTTDYGSTAAIPGSFSGTTTQAVSTNLPGLLPGTTYHFQVAATNILGANAGQDQVFTTLAPIEAWRLQWFGTTANSGPAADNAIATSDGMPNLLKYALGLNPLVATNDPVAGDISTGFLRLTVPKNPQATDVSFHVEVTDDITTAWTTNGTTVDINTATLLEAHANAPVASSAGAFIRLRVSCP